MTDLPAEQTIADAVGGIEIPGRLSDFASSLSTRHRAALRLRRHATREGLPLAAEPVPWYSLGYQPTSDEPRPSQLGRYATGDFFLQDAGSLLALGVSQADTSELAPRLICDLCASPGGKASALLEAISESTDVPSGGFLLANEAIRSRIGALQWNLARTGSNRYAVSNLDPDRLAEMLPATFDFVIVDAPCSGQALIGRGKQKNASLSAHQIQHSAARQERILDAATRLLRPGGTLVYSTCTFAFLENEAQVRRLVDSGRFQSTPQTSLDAYQTDPGCFRLWPHRDQCAGSFAGSLVSIDDGSREDSSPVRPRHRKTHRADRQAIISWKSDLGDVFEVDDSQRFHATDSTVIGWPADAPGWVEQIAMTGPELMHRTGNTWKPSHAAALRRERPGDRAANVPLDERQAQAYMRGEPIESSERGWQIVTFAGRPLGWAKGNGSVAKNHLPAAGRAQRDLLFV